MPSWFGSLIALQYPRSPDRVIEKRSPLPPKNEPDQLKSFDRRKLVQKLYQNCTNPLQLLQRCQRLQVSSGQFFDEL